MNDCVFCQIIKGKLPSYKVYEDKDFLGFLDIYPFNPGHILVIPKKHLRWVWQVENAEEYWSIANKLALRVIKNLKPKTIFFVTAGYEIIHAHIHIVPRFKNDGHGSFIKFDNKKNITKEKMQEIADKIYNVGREVPYK